MRACLVGVFVRARVLARGSAFDEIEKSRLGIVLFY